MYSMAQKRNQLITVIENCHHLTDSEYCLHQWSQHRNSINSIFYYTQKRKPEIEKQEKLIQTHNNLPCAHKKPSFTLLYARTHRLDFQLLILNHCIQEQGFLNYSFCPRGWCLLSRFMFSCFHVVSNGNAASGLAGNCEQTFLWSLHIHHHLSWKWKVST